MVVGLVPHPSSPEPAPQSSVYETVAFQPPPPQSGGRTPSLPAAGPAGQCGRGATPLPSASARCFGLFNLKPPYEQASQPRAVSHVPEGAQGRPPMGSMNGTLPSMAPTLAPGPPRAAAGTSSPSPFLPLYLRALAVSWGPGEDGVTYQKSGSVGGMERGGPGNSVNSQQECHTCAELAAFKAAGFHRPRQISGQKSSQLPSRRPLSPHQAS